MSPGTVDDGAFSFSGDLPRDRWVCVELAIQVDPAIGTVALSYDGAVQHAAPQTDSLVGTTGYTGMDLGVHYATPAQVPVAMWVDEVIADTAPIGCD